MNLTDYGALVFDLAPDTSSMSSVDFTSFTLYLNNMAMVTSDLPKSTGPTTVYNIIKETRKVEEGWESKYNSGTGGYGFIIALVIILLIAVGLLTLITIVRLRK